MIWSSQLLIEPYDQKSLTTKRRHVPFGLVPSKVDSATRPVGVGAGAGNGSPGS